MINQINPSQFFEADVRAGLVIKSEIFINAKKPSLKLWIDFGELGIKKSSAQITKLYTPELLIGKTIIAVVNFPPKQIANFWSECLVLGCPTVNGEVILLIPERDVPAGTKVA